MLEISIFLIRASLSLSFSRKSDFPFEMVSSLAEITWRYQRQNLLGCVRSASRLAQHHLRAAHLGGWRRCTNCNTGLTIPTRKRALSCVYKLSHSLVPKYNGTIIRYENYTIFDNWYAYLIFSAREISCQKLKQLSFMKSLENSPEWIYKKRTRKCQILNVLINHSSLIRKFILHESFLNRTLVKDIIVEIFNNRSKYLDKFGKKEISAPIYFKNLYTKKKKNIWEMQEYYVHKRDICANLKRRLKRKEMIVEL